MGKAGFEPAMTKVSRFTVCRLEPLSHFPIDLFSCSLNKVSVMPQLDPTSYFSQFFWLCATFGTFYLVLTKYILPQIAKVLFVRHQKAEQAQITQESPLQQETLHVQHTTGQHMTDACSKAKQAVQNAMQKSQEWMKEQTAQVQQKQLNSLQTQYTSQMKQNAYTYAHVSQALKHTLPPSAQAATQFLHPKNTPKMRVFDKTVVHTLFTK